MRRVPRASRAFRPPLPAPKSAVAPKPLVAVFGSSYEGCNSVTAQYDNYKCTPAHWVSKDFPYRFSYHELKKASSFSEIRTIMGKDKVACVFNLCDGAREESRAGEDVLRALERFNVPFTGANSDGFEPSKVTMKMLAVNGGVRTPAFAVVERGTDVAKACKHLNFPVIFKNISGYASVGITQESKCMNMKQLEKRVTAFVEKYDCALVEEFITGREGTVLVCADKGSRDGIKVFPPILMEFKGGAEDFSHFHNKWEDPTWVDEKSRPKALDINDLAYNAVVDMARNAYNLVLDRVGYGRVDFRIDQKTNEPYFLEVNANCGMFVPPIDPNEPEAKYGGDFADLCVQYDKDWSHDDFVMSQIASAVSQRDARVPWFHHVHNARQQFSARATRGVAEGTPLFAEVNHPVPVLVRTLFPVGKDRSGAAAPNAAVRPGCIVHRADDREAMCVLTHSCNPNLVIQHGITMEVIARRAIRKGELLTIDYGAVRDPSMPAFQCRCGAADCRREITPDVPRRRSNPARPREAKPKTARARPSPQAKDAAVGTSSPPRLPRSPRMPSHLRKTKVPAPPVAPEIADATAAVEAEITRLAEQLPIELASGAA